MTTPPVSWMVLALVGVVAIANAGPRESVPAPDADFLEFLGSWHAGDNDHRWVDPFQLDETPGVEGGKRSHVPADADRERKNLRLPASRDDAKHPAIDPTLPR